MLLLINNPLSSWKNTQVHSKSLRSVEMFFYCLEKAFISAPAPIYRQGGEGEGNYSMPEGTRALSPPAAPSTLPHTWAMPAQSISSSSISAETGSFYQFSSSKYSHELHCMIWHSKLTKLHSDLKIFSVTLLLQLERAWQVTCRSFAAQSLFNTSPAFFNISFSFVSLC